MPAPPPQHRTQVNTYFTNPTGRSELIYSAQAWARVEFQLETAGPVAVGTLEEITPVLSGLGVLLPPDGEPVSFVVPIGQRVYIASESINRVKVIIEPVPWLDRIASSLEKLLSVVMQSVRFFGARR